MAVTTPIAQKAAALASTKPAADALKAAREADIREDAAIDAEHDLSVTGTAKIRSDAGLGVSPEVEAHVASEVTRAAIAKVDTDGQPATTRARQPKKAETARKTPEGMTVKGNPRTVAWLTAKGEDVPVGARVKAPYKGVVKARCTKPAVNDQPRIAMVGILLDDPGEHARGVKVPTVPASEVVLA